MRGSLFLLFNHTITRAQEMDARANLGARRIVSPPDSIRRIWGQVPPDLPAIGPYLAPVRDWLATEAGPGDFVLIQGDFGACWLMVQFAFENKLIPVYATTEREALEEHQADGSIKIIHHFMHRMYRRYGI